ncbi:MAG: ATP-binding protein [Desulfomonilaceae bacterium]|jgi:PAS domain S-box-containing protein
MADKIDLDENARSESALRHVAAEKLGKREGAPSGLKGQTPEAIIHELQAHQIELETQNEELKRIQRALEESKDKYEDLYDFAPVGYFTLNHKGIIREVNLTGASLLRVFRSKLINRGFGRFVASECLDRWYQHIISVLGHEERQTCDLKLIREDGSTFYASFESIRMHAPAELQEDKSVTHVIRMAVSDITERKQIEEVLKQRTEELERSNKDLEQFAYVAAHDLREPLVAVAAYLKVLERLSKNPLEDVARTCIAKALNLALRMDSMLQGLLAYSRLTLTPISYEMTDCNTCLADAISNLGLSIKKRGAVVTSDTLPTLKIDASQLATIFQNLVGNAIKYGETGPLRVHVGFISRESYYQFSVSDNGIGIEPPYLDRIFNLFERVKDLSGPMGTGIGLSTCRKIVERYGGRIWVDSKVGKGSTFYFTLPNS